MIVVPKHRMFSAPVIYVFGPLQLGNGALASHASILPMTPPLDCFEGVNPAPMMAVLQNILEHVPLGPGPTINNPGD